MRANNAGKQEEFALLTKNQKKKKNRVKILKSPILNKTVLATNFNSRG
jgi:hypothetical protein